MFALENGDRHVVASTEPNMKLGLKELLAALPESECRYVVFEHSYKTADGRPQDKVYFISWFPRSCSATQKMLYSTGLGALREVLKGCLDLQASTQSEITQALAPHSPTKDDDEASDAGDDWMD